MAKLSKLQLLAVVEDAIRESGWSFLRLTTGATHPARYHVFRDGVGYRVRVHIWNVTPGGRSSLPHEYRIQMTGIATVASVRQIQPEIGGKTLILGWWDWETCWNDEARRYQPEPFSFAADLNQVIECMATSPRPPKYHTNEDVLVEGILHELKWPIQKKGNQWTGADYASMLEQGGFRDLDQKNLIAAATGRVHAALDYGQLHFDEMHTRHRHMLTALLTIIIYHRYCDGSSFLH
jgi:Methylase-associated X1